ncbi:acyltransferase family protein [Kocuria rosea]|uniref:acyltransferase family protein n=1 Tax=Kocuria rosea TaxID=1275 RepID=UPI00232DA3D2|nr:acyltransferase [Kocuria rosea]
MHSTPRLAPSLSTSRVDWADTAKGIAILVVALHHTVIFLNDADLLSGPWVQANNAFQSFRMPLFFAAAGLFAASALRGAWGRLWTRRLALLVWVFAVWTLVRFGFFLVIPNENRPQETALLTLLLAPVDPSNGMWFLHALVIFFVVAKLMYGRLDYRVQLGAAAALSMVVLTVPGTSLSWDGMGSYFFFFLAGCYLRDKILTRVAQAKAWHLVAAGVLFVGAVGVLDVLGWQLIGPAAFVVRCLAVSFGFLLAAALTRWVVVGPVLNSLGRQTLPIYVTHVLFIAATTTVLGATVESPGAVLLILPLAVLAFAVVGSLALHRAIKSVPLLRYAYQAPAWMARQSQVGSSIRV